jgi:hypothetical protein
MRICIGIHIADGIVIAADAEEGDSHLKRPQQNIFPWMGAPNSVTASLMLAPIRSEALL